MAPTCPDCQGDLSFVASWSVRGLWGYEEVRTHECSTHGPIFIKRETFAGHRRDTGPAEVPDNAPEDGDRDSVITAPRKPAPAPNADAIAIPEPDSY